MTTDTPTRLREIEARLKSAHVAPCSVERRDESDGKISFELWCQPDGAGSLDRVVVFYAHEALSQKYVRARATLYAHVPADIPWLLNQLSAQSAEVAKLREALEPFAALGAVISDPRSKDAKAKDDAIFVGQCIYNVVGQISTRAHITFGDLRQAAALAKDAAP